MDTSERGREGKKFKERKQRKQFKYSVADSTRKRRSEEERKEGKIPSKMKETEGGILSRRDGLDFFLSFSGQLLSFLFLSFSFSRSLPVAPVHQASYSFVTEWQKSYREKERKNLENE